MTDDQLDSAFVLGRATKLRAFNLEDLNPDPETARKMAGSLIIAAEVLIDGLFQDLDAIRAGEPVDELEILSDLPPRHDSRYDVAFARRFLVAAIDLTARLTRPGWETPSCTAQELVVRLLLGQATATAEIAELGLPEEWTDDIAELMLEDLDHEYLYADHFQLAPELGAVNLAFYDWFEPFEGRTLPPYLLGHD